MTIAAGKLGPKGGKPSGPWWDKLAACTTVHELETLLEAAMNYGYAEGGQLCQEIIKRISVMGEG